jgi:hypothetical protein
VLSKPSEIDYLIYQLTKQGITVGASASINEISYVMEPDLVINIQFTVATYTKDALLT